MTRILLVQGVNMAYLGMREPDIYGTTTAAELDALLALIGDEKPAGGKKT